MDTSRRKPLYSTELTLNSRSILRCFSIFPTIICESFKNLESCDWIRTIILSQVPDNSCNLLSRRFQTVTDSWMLNHRIELELHCGFKIGPVNCNPIRHHMRTVREPNYRVDTRHLWISHDFLIPVSILWVKVASTSVAISMTAVSKRYYQV